jgi:hypothetical protein
VPDPSAGVGSKPIYVQTVVSDPDSGPGNADAPPEANPGSGAAVTAQPFFLHDTPCSSSSQQPVTASHATHDTARTGATCTGSFPPDLMDAAPAPDGDGVPMLDYSSDLVRTAPAGLALRRFSTGCPVSYADADAATQRWSIHTWATPAFASAFSTPVSGAASAFSFWTNSVDGAPGGATLCLTLRAAGQPGTALASAAYTLQSWPTTPTQLSFRIDHQPFTIAAGDRLLLTVSVRSTSDNDIELLYDNPGRRTFLSVATTTPLPSS